MEIGFHHVSTTTVAKKTPHLERDDEVVDGERYNDHAESMVDLADQSAILKVWTEFLPPDSRHGRSQG